MNARSIVYRLAVAAAVVAVGSLGLAAPALAAPAFDWPNARIDLPWTAATLSDDSVCPGGRVRFTEVGPASPDTGQAERAHLTYLVQVVGTADVTGDGRADTVVRFACRNNQTGAAEGWFFLYTVRQRPVLVDYITSSDEQANAEWAVMSIGVRPGAVDVTQVIRSTNGFEFVDRTFTWTGTELVADQPLPIHPEADTAP